MYGRGHIFGGIRERAEPRHEIRKRISATMALLQKLDVFWLKTNCSRRWKLLVFNAVVTSKVLYGLETLEPTCSVANVLDTFQLKGLRKILRLHTTFVQRNNTNEYVYKRANEVLGAPTEGVETKIKPLTEVLAQKRLKLLGHVVRRERQHPLHQSAFKTQSAVPRETEHRRIGWPRKFWTTTNMEKAWITIKSLDTSIRDIPFNKHDREIREKIIDHAKRYQPPFS